MKHLLTLLGSLTMIGGAGATVVACGNQTKAPTPEDDLRKEIEEATNKITKWKDSIPQKIKQEIDEAILKAQELLDKSDATEEEIKEAISNLTQIMTDYNDSLPAAIVTKAINNNEKDIKDLFPKDWTYSSFFNMNEEKSEDGNLRILDLLYQPVYEIAFAKGYSAEEASALQQKVLDWSHTNVNLVYLNEVNGQQQIKETIVNKEKNQEPRKLEDIFIEQVEKEFPDQELDAAFWEAHPKLSLGISFDKTDLNAEAKDFWTFTFVQNLKSEENVIKEVVKKAAEDGITFEISKSEDIDAFNLALATQFKKLFYGKVFIPGEAVVKFDKSPTEEQITKGTGETPWDGKDVTVSFYDGQNKNEPLFTLNTNYQVSVI